MTQVAVILSGCGHLDGAEIRESVLTLLYLDQRGANVSIFAPNEPQMHVVDHRSGRVVEGQTRNVMEEAARIARGRIADLATLDPEAFEALVIPGGFGVAKNLSNLAEKGADADVHPELLRVVNAFYAAQKPIGAICIAPAVLTAALRGKGVRVTIGDDAGTAAAITAMGGVHHPCVTTGVVLDEYAHIASCPAYMHDAPLSEIAQGIEQVIAFVMQQAEAAKRAA
jgi:enhancing lycopene biosynthesis protein 2